MKKILAAAVLCLFTNSAFASGPVVHCMNEKGRDVTVIIGGVASFSATVFTRANVGPAIQFKNLKLSEPNVLGEPKIFSGNNPEFTLTVIALRNVLQGTLNIPSLGIANESMACND